jgi:4-aminobutyrate aminotransferase-like enzyme
MDPQHNVLKIKPPIVFNKTNVDTLIEKLKETLTEIQKEW